MHNDPEKKRKRSTIIGTTNTPKQQTISELFSTNQQKVPQVTKPIDSTDGKTASPKHKRQKLGSIASSPPRRETLPAKSMYEFPSRNRATSNSNVVDLTESPTGTPSSRRAPKPFSQTNYNPRLGAKKLVVKNLRTIPRADPNQYLNQTWEKLSKALDAIFRDQKIPYSLEELYRGVENVCRQGHAAELCGRLEKLAKTYAEDLVKSGQFGDDLQGNTLVLGAVVTAWAVWNKQMDTIRGIFFYMDRAYLLQTKRPSIQEMGVALFRSIIFEDKKLQHKILEGICEIVTADRSGTGTDIPLCKEAIAMFHDLTVYANVVEPRLLHMSQTFVKGWADHAVNNMGLAEYVNASVELMDTEFKRCEVVGLDLSTRRALLTLLEHQLIQRQQDTLLNPDGLHDLLDENAVQDLERLYSLLARRDLHEKLRKAFETWIELTGTAIIFDEKEQDSMVVKLLTLKRQLDNIWRVSFHRNVELGHGLRGSFDIFINKTKKNSATWGTDNSKPGEMIAKYVDMLLRGGSKAIRAALTKSTTKAPDAMQEDEDNEVTDEDEEVNEQLDQVLDLFRFVHGKAVFEAFYKKDLARRLLMGRSASADAERSMLSRLKTECGANFTQNLEQMFKDVELGREEMNSYKSHMTEQERTPIVDLSVNILSASAWPTYPDIPVNIPVEVKKEIERFENHYQMKHSGRKLDWKHALAHCQLKANFPKGKKEVVVSSFQAIVLLLFNRVKEDEKVLYDTLKAETGLPEAELNRTLQSLACAKLRPLRKIPPSRDISPTDVFTLNPSFTHSKYRIKINQVQLKETAAENKETHERVQADRNFETQAAIVRIMKGKGRIGHQLLVAEVIEATRKRGVLSVPDIKRNIDRLIEKEYMEREEGNMYAYVA
ncbi:Cullin-domain-containing protein [Tothia fuscella]|uniref:Cullin-domain-containing protein n=1 Tax=Tothia fuscella TaxID=1048955 RepID=A0A9P4TVR3_9PEZI|nr:Cullin-domain-containing protein [Tothia fuscella]